MTILFLQTSFLAVISIGMWFAELLRDKLDRKKIKLYRMPERKNPETSNEAWRSITNEQLNDTYKQIIYALNNIGEGTFEDIAAFLKVDKTKIWKRMSELARMEIVYRPGTKKVLKSGRNGYTWRLSSKGIAKTTTENKKSNNKTITDHSRTITWIQQNIW